MWSTSAGQDQAAAWHDGGELELPQMWMLCRTSSTSSPLWCGIAGHQRCQRYWTNTVAGEVARGVGDQEHVEGEGELRLVVGG